MRMSTLLVGLSAGLGPGVAVARPDCPPSALVDGDASVQEIKSALTSLGVAVAPAPAVCEQIQATVTSSAGRYHVVIRDGAGRVEDRDAPDARLAAQLIETWARGDLVAGLLEPAEAPRIDYPAGPPPTSVQTQAFAPSEQTRLGIDARAELGASEDGAIWYGARASARRGLGPIDALLAARLSLSAHQPAPRQSIAQRLGFELMVGAELPLAVGPLELAPGLALGLGVLNTRRAQARGCGDNGDGPCGSDAPPLIGDGLAKTTVLPRAEATISGKLRFGERWAALLGLSGSWSPAAHTADFEPSYAEGSSPAARAQLALSGEPRFVGRAMLGLSWEPR